MTFCRSLGGFARLPLIAFILLLLGGCHRDGASSNIHFSYEIAPRPVKVGNADVTLRLSDFSAKPETGAQVTLETDMAHPGMAPVFSEMKEIAAGEYRGQTDFNMSGDWVLLVRGKLSDGSKFERQIAVPGVEAK
jgi:YtkA-like protein